MATQEKPPRPWKIDDLLALGEKQGKKGTYLKAVPVLILENWVLEGREEGSVANYVYTKDLARRLERCRLVSSFKPKATGGIFGSLTSRQKSQNLTRPPLIRYEGEGRSWINLPHYVLLLQDYRREYCKRYPKDYERLFPEGEPEWEPSLPKVQAERSEAEPMLAEPEVQVDIRSILAPVEQALRGQQQALERLTEENRRLQAGLEAKTKESPDVLFVHTSPYFHDSTYDTKVASIKDTTAAMLQRAERSIRISTMQMDMFTDELIALKRHKPDLEITVLSRGRDNTEGDRKSLAREAFAKMKPAGIKLPVEKAALHSRMVVIDEREVLVSSADLDYTMMDLQFNAGIWTNNPDVIAAAIRYFDNLLKSPTVENSK